VREAALSWSPGSQDIAETWFGDVTRDLEAVVCQTHTELQEQVSRNEALQSEVHNLRSKLAEALDCENRHARASVLKAKSICKGAQASVQFDLAAQAAERTALKGNQASIEHTQRARAVTDAELRGDHPCKSAWPEPEWNAYLAQLEQKLNRISDLRQEISNDDIHHMSLLLDDKQAQIVVLQEAMASQAKDLVREKQLQLEARAATTTELSSMRAKWEQALHERSRAQSAAEEVRRAIMTQLAFLLCRIL
jgi:hypothetical protein